jgi:hypothetical protein
MFACSFAAAFGAIQQMPQIVPGLPEVKEQVEGKPAPAARAIEQAAASHATKIQEIGGLMGRFALAALVLYVASRRKLIRLFLVPGLVLMPIIFGWAAITSLQYLHIGIFIAGFLTVAQFSFWGNYLPHAYPVHLRGTGESFAANIGGRLIGTCFFGVTQWIAYFLPIEASDPTKVAYAAAGVAFTVYLVNFIMSFFLPEPKAGEFEE